MEMSEKERDLLRSRYEVLGLAKVREELAREERDPLMPKEMTDFAREWVAAEEAKVNDLVHRLKIIAGVGGTVLVAVVTVVVLR